MQLVARIGIDTHQSLQEQEYFDFFREKGPNKPFHWNQRTTASTSTQVTCLIWWQLDTHDTLKAYYWELHYEALGNTISCLEDQFNQPGYKIYCNLEELLIKASMKENFNELAIPLFLWLLPRRLQLGSSRSTAPHLWCQLPTWHHIQWQINTAYHIWYHRSLQGFINYIEESA